MQPYFLPNHVIPKTAFTARPICDAYHRNPGPGPYTIRCRRRASVALTLLTPADCCTAVRCPRCAAELRQQARVGATFEIIADLPVKELLPMTNRIQYTETLAEPATKEQEVLWLANLLAEMGQPATIHNAQTLLSIGLQNAPGKWLLTMADLVTLWPALAPQSVEA